MTWCRYKKLLYGDISAVCGVMRVPQLYQLIQATVCIYNIVYVYILFILTGCS